MKFIRPLAYSSLLAASLVLTGCEEIAGTVIAGGFLVWGLGSLLLLALLIYAIVDLVKSPMSSEKKILWGVIILIIPYIGALLYLFVGRGSSARV